MCPQYEIYLIAPKQKDLVESFKPYLNGYAIIKQPWWMIISTKKPLIKPIFRFFKILRYAYKTLKYLKTIEPDIVMTNTIASPVTALACRWGGYTHFWFIHEVPPHVGIYSYLYSEKRILRWLDHLSKSVFVVSDYTLNYYKSYISGMNRICKIHVAVGTDLVKGAGGEHPYYTLLLIGHFDDNKGQEDAVKAAKLLVTKFNLNFRLLLVGATAGAYTNYISEFIQKNNLGEYVSILEYTTHISTYYEQSDVLLVCSRSETLSKVDIEAQKMGLPVVATDIEANREQIRNNYNGILYRRGDIDELALAITKLSDPILRKEMGRNAKEFMSGKYTMGNYISDFLQATDL
ncbi:MAG: glycosyltransferase [Bacteroides sp.]|nr:glycosyltransferase [Bacteroides sp.]MDD3036343.1 glycosyltransferase [Bacteroides sp.]